MGKCKQGDDDYKTPGIKKCKINGIACELSDRDDSDQCPIFLQFHERMEGKK